MLRDLKATDYFLNTIKKTSKTAGSVPCWGQVYHFVIMKGNHFLFISESLLQNTYSNTIVFFRKCKPFFASPFNLLLRYLNFFIFDNLGLLWTSCSKASQNSVHLSLSPENTAISNFDIFTAVTSSFSFCSHFSINSHCCFIWLNTMSFICSAAQLCDSFRNILSFNCLCSRKLKLFLELLQFQKTFNCSVTNLFIFEDQLCRQLCV